MAQYTIGLDFGTLSGRAVLVDASNGTVAASAVSTYRHGVMDHHLPDGTVLPKDWALQHPQDYLDVLDQTIPALLAQSGVNKKDVLAIGVDFTSSTTLPVDNNGTPLCFLKDYQGEPHAYVKLWKHHAAQPEAANMLQTALERNEPWLDRYGGGVSAEWSLPKLWQVYREAPAVYHAMDSWMEAGDWIVRQLCGRHQQSACAAGYKSFYRKGIGFPDEAYFAALDEGLRTVVREKLSAPVVPVFSGAGGLTKEMAQRLGLEEGTVVSAAMVDAHACVPAAGITQAGEMLAIIGTSACYMALGQQGSRIPGISGVVEDGILPGQWGYEAGQSCVGDLLAWYAEHGVPKAYADAAHEQQLTAQQYLTKLAEPQRPGEHGLLALDWWNGNRSILMDSELSGLLLGMTLQTKPEDIYRALIEATAFGAKTILETFISHGIAIDTLHVTGGICQKNSMMMQIYADVLNMPIHVVSASEGGALGSAIIAAAAAGLYASAEQSIRAMSAPTQKVYVPIAANAAVYERLYGLYCTLHDRFGRTEPSFMHTLKALRNPG